jgi:hypothetical protein
MGRGVLPSSPERDEAKDHPGQQDELAITRPLGRRVAPERGDRFIGRVPLVERQSHEPSLR